MCASLRFNAKRFEHPIDAELGEMVTSSASSSDRALARNIAYDHRVPPAREDAFLAYYGSSGPVRRSLKLYREHRIAHATPPHFLDPVDNYLNFLAGGPFGSGPIAGDLPLARRSQDSRSAE